MPRSASTATSQQSGAAANKAPATRRTPQQVRTLLLDSARELFAAKGYAGASTRDIAVNAGVSEALLFRHFGTKAKLFERAILDPLREFIHRYAEHWKAQPPSTHSAESVSRAFVEGLYDLVSEHRELVMALVAAQAYESLDELEIPTLFAGFLSELEELARQEADARGYTFDVPVTVRLIVGQIMAVALLDEWLFSPKKRRPARQRIVDELTAQFVHGLAHRGEPAG